MQTPSCSQEFQHILHKKGQCVIESIESELKYVKYIVTTTQAGCATKRHEAAMTYPLTGSAGLTLSGAVLRTLTWTGSLPL